MTDKELVSYFYTHSRTERALFAKGDVIRMLKLAGETPQDVERWPSFVTVRQAAADYWIERAEKRIRLRSKLRVINGGKE